MAFPAYAQMAPPWPGNGQADSIRPDPRLTPGGVATSDPGVFCHAGYSRSVRHTSGRVKRQVYRAYGIDRRSGSYEIDHLVPLAIGGSDEPATRREIMPVLRWRRHRHPSPRDDAERQGGPSWMNIARSSAKSLNFSAVYVMISL